MALSKLDELRFIWNNFLSAVAASKGAGPMSSATFALKY